MDNSSRKFSFADRARSFRYAFSGLVALFRSAHNARIHAVAAMLAIALSVFFGISTWEWVAVILCIAIVISAEAFNSAIESLADAVTRERHPDIKLAKDISAAAVLVLAAVSVVVGLVIFIPYIISLFSN